LALPNLKEQDQNEIRDQLPQSGSGKLITTVEPKFIPKDSMEIDLGSDTKVNLRLIDCVGFMVPDALGNMENEKERMVKTPWFEDAVPFAQAAEIGTKKVISDHSTIGLLVTTDGSFGEIPRENYVGAEEKTVQELKKQGKPFVIILNTVRPYSEDAQNLANEISQKYQADCIPVNCDQLRRDDIVKILEHILYEFPVRQVEFYIPKWVELLSLTSPLKKQLVEKIKEMSSKIRYVRDVKSQAVTLDCDYVKETNLMNLDLSTGIVKIRIDMKEKYYYEMMSQMTGVDIEGEYDLMHTLQELSLMKQEYVKVKNALESVRGCGYGVVIPEKGEITMDDPVLIKQGNKFGVKMKSTSPSIHMIKANIETEIAPIVGTEDQANDLIAYIKESSKKEDGIWNTNIFGKSVEQLVEDGIKTKVAQITEESQVKLQDSMQKIVNDSKDGMYYYLISP
jgi:stage IV sporulation protein A